MTGQRPWSRVGALFALVVAAQGLGVAEVAAQAVVQAAPTPAPFVSVTQNPTPEMEARSAAAQHPSILARFGNEYKDGAIGAYVTAVGNRVVQHITGYDVPYDFHFYVLDSSEVFAFALPGGYVYVSRALLVVANSESEVAAVIAHEIAHVILRHGAQRSNFAAERGNNRGEAAQAMHAFTREQEFEADAVGVRLIAAAGYDPMAQARFLRAIDTEGAVEVAYGMAPPPPKDQTHPEIPERIAAAAAAADAVIAERADAGLATKWFDGHAEFLDAIDGLVFGRRPADGMVVGTTFVNTTARYTFVLPPGFHFTRADRTIIAAGPDGAGMRFDAQTAQKPQGTDMADYLRRNTGGGLKLQAVTPGTVDGLAYATAFARPPEIEGGGRILLAVIRVTDNTVFRFQFFVPDTMSDGMVARIWDTPQSFRRMAADEVARWQPLRVRVVTAAADMPPVAMAAQMRVVDHPLNWLLTLNRLESLQPLGAGARVKLIAN